MKTIAIVQSRMGSTRLPGKVMLSLDCTPVVRHVVRRCLGAKTVDSVVVATTEKRRDDIVERYAQREGAEIFRGDETDVLGRVYRAGNTFDADMVVRITADNPLTSPAVIDGAVEMATEGGYDYVSNKIDRTFPAGLDVEVFTFDSFETVEQRTDDPYDREHVTPYYRNSGEFELANLQSTDVFDEEFMHDRTELRLTLDTPDDFDLFARVYRNAAYDEILDVREAVRYIDEKNLAELNVD